MKLLDIFKAKATGDYGNDSQAGYADPGLQADKKPRYPLKVDGKLNEERIRAAWNYINKPENAGTYSHADAGAIKDRIVSAWKDAIDPAGPPAASKDAAKAAIMPAPADPGVYVYRPVLNADSWFKWGQKIGIPNLLPAAQMHVSILYSRTTVNMVSDLTIMTIMTEAGRFCGFGGEENVLAFTWDDWALSWRNDAFVMAGAVSDWPIFRPHMTLSMDAAGFVLTQQMMDEAPQTVILGAEVWGALKPADPGDAGDADDLTEDVTEIELSALRGIYEDTISTPEALDVLSRQTVRSALSSQKISRKSIAHLANDPTLTDTMKAKMPRAWGAPKPAKIVPKMTEKTKSVIVTVNSMPEVGGERIAELRKSGRQRQVYRGWASVSTVKGIPVRDLEDEEITTEAMTDFAYLIMKSRASKMEHAGAVVNEIVESCVFDDDLQKCFGIDLGFEGHFVGIYVPDPVLWAEICKADDGGRPYELSIAARVRVMEIT